MTSNSVFVLSLQVFLVMLLFAISSLVGFLTTMAGAGGGRTITFVSLLFSVVACFAMQNTMNIPNDTNFWNSAFICWLMMGSGVAFLTVACFEEVLNGTRQKLMSSRWYNLPEEEGGMLVYVQAVCLT